jgi:flagellar assembly protein FliH
MTSSFKSNPAASVRQTAGVAPMVAGVWSLSELAVAVPDAPSPKHAAARAHITDEQRALLIEEGYARGLVDGERLAAVAAQAGFTEAMDVVSQLTAQLREVGAMAPVVLEENISALAVIVARQIVAREVSLDRELVADLVRRALTEFPIDQGVRIRVNPLDLALLTLKLGDSGDAVRITGDRDASWLADPRVARGGCLVEGRDRIVDGRVDTALERAYRRMAELDAS